MIRIGRRARGALLVSALAGGLLALAPLSLAQATSSSPTPVALTLLGNWKSAQVAYQTGLPTVSLDNDGIVHLSGGILKGTAGSLAFTLPVGDRPASYLYINTYTYQTTQGFLRIQPDGGVYAYGASSSGYTDLAGIQFPAAVNTLSTHSLTTVNGWTSADSTYSSGDPAYALDSVGYVHLSGSLKGGSSATEAFVLPVHNRPANEVYLNVYTLDGTLGTLDIEPNGDVYVYGSSVGGYTSLAGITFRANGSILQAKALTLENGWTVGGYNSGKATVSRDQYGFVHLNGAVSNPGDGAPAFVLPKADLPPHTLYLTTYGFDGSVDSVVIYTNGEVAFFGQATGTTPPSTADEFTTLDGLTFAALS
jgi:hypothetical protein